MNDKEKMKKEDSVTPTPFDSADCRLSISPPPPAQQSVDAEPGTAAVVAAAAAIDIKGEDNDDDDDIPVPYSPIFVQDCEDGSGTPAVSSDDGYSEMMNYGDRHPRTRGDSLSHSVATEEERDTARDNAAEARFRRSSDPAEDDDAGHVGNGNGNGGGGAVASGPHHFGFVDPGLRKYEPHPLRLFGPGSEHMYSKPISYKCRACDAEVILYSRRDPVKCGECGGQVLMKLPNKK